ncbi:N-acetylmuramoyl-L-alanine amidase [Streptosporangiaceae bacterium NEAU-GS5]|nr:N-acetylmuramoyl-L-alanine amidase [Streptosporangiaceae bacterium NEAU-GS5]
MRFAGRALIALAWAGALTACSGSGDSGYAPVGAAPPVGEVERTATWPVPSQGADSANSAESAQPVVPTPKAGTRTPGKPLAGKIVVLDPGHNGGNASHPKEINRLVDIVTGRKPCNTTGTATDSGYSEHAFNWDVAIRLQKVLKKEGATVVLTRLNDQGVGPCIDARAAIGTKAKADAVLSIHADGAGPSDHGFHVILPGRVPGHNDAIIASSQRLGLAIRSAYRAGTGVPYANYIGKKAIAIRTDLGGLNLATRPSVLIECGNMRNKGDAADFTSASFRQKAADSLAVGLTAFLTSS